MTISIEEYQEAEEENAGFCTDCKKIVNHGSVEPDAQNYKCEDCGEMTVFGIPEAFIQELIDLN